MEWMCSIFGAMETRIALGSCQTQSQAGSQDEKIETSQGNHHIQFEAQSLSLVHLAGFERPPVGGS